MTHFVRIGVVQSGRVLEERVLPVGRVTVGSRADNTIVVFGAPESTVVFDSGAAASEVGARGRIRISAELAVLFHVVAEMPVEGTPDLHGNLWAHIEPVFTAVIVASFVLHAAVAVFVKVTNPPQPADALGELRAMIDTMAPLPPVMAPVIERPATTPTTAPATNSPATVARGDDDVRGTGAHRGPRGSAPAIDRAAVRGALEGRGLLQLIGGARDDGEHGGVGSVFGARGPVTDDVTKALAHGSGVDVARAGAVDVARRAGDAPQGDGHGFKDGVRDPRALAPPGTVDTGEKRAARVPAVHTDEIETDDPTARDVKQIKLALARRADAFQTCYESTLKGNTALKGKLVIEVTVAERGNVTDVHVARDALGSDAVKSCVVDVIRRVKFPPAEGGDVTVSSSLVFQPGG